MVKEEKLGRGQFQFYCWLGNSCLDFLQRGNCFRMGAERNFQTPNS